MFIKSENGIFETTIDGVCFACYAVDEQVEESATKIAKIYPDRLNDIAQFMLQEGISDFFGPLSVEKLIQSLGTPLVNLSNNSITYLEQTLDDTHIISFEFTGLLDKFFYLNIDG